MKNIGILTFPGNKKEVTPVSNLISVINKLSNNLHIITGKATMDLEDNEKLFFHRILHKVHKHPFKRIFAYIKTQIIISYQLFKVKDVDVWIFFIGGETLILPMLVLKILRKKVILVFPGSSIKTLFSSGDKLYIIAKILSEINCRLSDTIVLYSSIFLSEWGLSKHKNKVVIGREHFLDLKEFRIKKDYQDRSELFGYIGRLSEEKGIINLIKALPDIIKENGNIKFIIVGNGHLESEIKSYIDLNELNNNVEILGWINHSEIPNFLNNLKLLLIPSYTEGLPNIMLEAMACGTPVLATPVGAIGDVLEDGHNGFIMKNNTPFCLARNFYRAVNYLKMDDVIRNARLNVEKEFSQENVYIQWEKILFEN